MIKKSLLILCLFISLNAYAENYLATIWGIKGDGNTDNTSSIQHAVNWIAQQGGGTLVFPAGNYLTAPIQFPDNVTISLMNEALWIGIGNDEKSQSNPLDSCPHVHIANSQTAISFHRQQLTDSIIYASTFGIKSNGTTLNTKSIQYAIDFMANRGGGTLAFQVGRYLTGTIHMRDNVNIELGSGAILVASDNPLDYDPVDVYFPLIDAESVNNCRIYGIGVIEGNGDRFNENMIHLIAKGVVNDELETGRSKYKQVLLNAHQSHNIELTNLNLRTPGWVAMTFDSCVNVMMTNLTIDAHTFFPHTYMSDNSHNVQEKELFMNCIDK